MHNLKLERQFSNLYTDLCAYIQANLYKCTLMNSNSSYAVRTNRIDFKK